MSQKILFHRDCSYSQYRNKKSANKLDLSKSIHQLDISINTITVSKTSQLQSIQKQLFSLIRKKSTSSSTLTKKSPDMKALNKSTKNMKFQTAKYEIKGKQNISTQQIELSQRKLKSKHSFLLNQTFQPIQENCTQNQQDDINQKKEENLKISAIKNKKTDMKKKTNNLPHTKMAQSIVVVKKTNVNLKATIDQLDDMQKKLQNNKNTKKPQIKLKQSSNKQPLSNRLHRVASQNKILTYKQRAIGETLRFKANQHLPLSSISINIQNIHTQRLVREKPQSSKSILPTKMINSKDKQKLLLDLQNIQETIKNSQISYQNMQNIKLAMKNLIYQINN